MQKLLHGREGDMAVMAIGIAVVLITGIIAATVYFSVSTEVPGASGYAESFAVDNSSTDEEYETDYTPSSLTLVEVYNDSDANWTTVSSSLYEQDGKTITVNASAYDDNSTYTRISYDTLATDSVTDYTTYAKLAFGFIGLGAFIGAAFLIIGIMRGDKGGI